MVVGLPSIDVAARTPTSRPARVLHLRRDGTTSTAVLGGGLPDLVLDGSPDPRLADVATVGLRRLHHVRIAIDRAGPSCTVSGSTRTPVQRPVPLGAALALAERGIPTFVTVRTEA